MDETGLDGRRRAVIWLAGATRAACGGMLTTALALVVGRMQSPLAVSSLAVVFFASTMIFAPLWGSLADTTGRRRALLVGTGIAATLVLVGLQFISSAWGYIAARGAYTVFAVGFAPVILAIVNDVTGYTTQGRSAGLVNRTFAVGDIGGQIAIGALLGLAVPSVAFAIIAGVSFLGTAAVALIHDSPPVATNGGLRRGLKRLFPSATEWRVLRRTGLDRLYAALVLRHIAVQGIGVLVPIYVVSRLDVTASTMGLLLAVSPTTQLATLPFIGKIADAGYRVRLLGGGIAASAAYPLALALAAMPKAVEFRLSLAVVGFVCLAVGFAAMDVGAVAVISAVVPRRRTATFLGLRATAMGLGGIIGSVLVGVVALMASIRVAFIVGSLPAFGAALLVMSSVSEPDDDGETPLLNAVEPVFANTRLPGLWWR
ncbi:MFS transporter [Halorussus sp. AFM4]|uniref:MFS transporter n=1 Tax=Halorussus sp. AFM4 TaxID=3421651 RepID=UPI003EBB246C